MACSTTTREAGGGLPPVFFLLLGGQARVGVFLGFAGFLVRQIHFAFIIIFVGPQKAQIHPQTRLAKPRQSRLENLFHKRVIVDAPRRDAAQQENLPIEIRDGQRLDRVSFFYRCSVFPARPGLAASRRRIPRHLSLCPYIDQ